MKRGALFAVLVVLVALAGAGCRFGGASFEGLLADRPFEPTGTVFGYVDAHDEALVVDDTDPPVAIAATWLVFDPTSDLADLDGSELESYAHELRLRDALSLVFAKRSDVGLGAAFTSTVEAGAETGDGALRARVHLAPERLDASKTYADFVPFAGRRVVRVEIDEADFDNLRSIAGRLSVSYVRADGDPEDVKEGSVSGEFRAPLVDERIAERNLSLLQAQEPIGLPTSAPQDVP
jgi:hypothetical protein